jgi:glutamine phosphoribosylpyrophosphate amidotransferase
MCAICGIGLLFDKKLKDSKALSTFFTTLLLACQGGGRSASGVSFIREHKADVLRRGISSSQLIHTEEYIKLIRECINLEEEKKGEKLVSIIGHCRIPTKGTPVNNKNNHPVVVDNIIGVHNGAIGNDDNLFRKYNFSRIAQVDTEIIFQLIAHHTKGEKSTETQEAIIKAAKEMAGSYACAVQNTHTPYNLYIFRAHNPTSVRYYYEDGFVAFATSESYLETADKSVKLGKFREIKYDKSSGISFNLFNQKMTPFNLEEDERGSIYGYM